MEISYHNKQAFYRIGDYRSWLHGDSWSSSNGNNFLHPSYLLSIKHMLTHLQWFLAYKATSRGQAVVYYVHHMVQLTLAASLTMS